jgi:hypothetical protein
MNIFDHKDLGNHLLQLCPKVVKHPVYIKGNIRERNMCIISEYLSPFERCCPKNNNLRRVTVNTISTLTITGSRRLRWKTITFSEQEDKQ